jgi:hypothetical protein
MLWNHQPEPPNAIEAQQKKNILGIAICFVRCYFLCLLAAYNDGAGRVAAHWIGTLQ